MASTVDGRSVGERNDFGFGFQETRASTRTTPRGWGTRYADATERRGSDEGNDGRVESDAWFRVVC